MKTPLDPLIARVKKLVPADAQVEPYMGDVITITFPRTETSYGGIVSIIGERSVWSPGCTSQPSRDLTTGHRWMGRVTYGYTGRGWLEAMTKDALAAITESGKRP